MPFQTMKFPLKCKWLIKARSVLKVNFDWWGVGSISALCIRKKRREKAAERGDTGCGRHMVSVKVILQEFQGFDVLWHLSMHGR